MTSEERRQAVAAILAEDPAASQRTIAARLSVGQRTVGRDIAALRRDSVVTQAAARGVSAQVNSGDSERIVAALNAELAAAAKEAGHELVWSTAEADIIGMIAAAVDRRVELSVAYAACDNVNTKLKLATELRLLEQSIGRLYRQVSTDVPAPQSATSMKASRAARSRWDRERMKAAANATQS